MRRKGGGATMMNGHHLMVSAMCQLAKDKSGSNSRWNTIAICSRYCEFKKSRRRHFKYNSSLNWSNLNGPIWIDKKLLSNLNDIRFCKDDLYDTMVTRWLFFSTVNDIIFSFRKTNRNLSLDFRIKFRSPSHKTRVQFHQQSTCSFCANSLAPVKYKPKT